MKVEYLQHLCNILKEVPDSRLIKVEDTETSFRFESKQKGFNLIAWGCGTTCCAIGFATLDPLFNREGFKYWVNSLGTLAPLYRELTGWTAVSKFFEITGEEADYLFSQDKYSNGNNTVPSEVVSRIEAFIQNEGI